MKIERFEGYFVPVPPPGKDGSYWLFIKLITDDGIEGTGGALGTAPPGSPPCR